MGFCFREAWAIEGKFVSEKTNREIELHLFAELADFRD